jgi:hypothetical protein
LFERKLAPLQAAAVVPVPVDVRAGLPSLVVPLVAYDGTPPSDADGAFFDTLSLPSCAPI